jgi:WD40 repeat protein
VIIKANNLQHISPVNKSSFEYFTWLENSFQNLINPQNIIGIHKINRRILCTENITKNTRQESLTCFGTHKQRVSSIISNHSLNLVIVGDRTGSIKQYDLSKGRSHCKLQKEYLDSGLISVCSSAQIGNLVVFGDSNFCVRAFDLRRREIISGLIETDVKYVLSLEFCRLVCSKVYLCVTGAYSDCSSDKTNIFDITELVKEVNKSVIETRSVIKKVMKIY